jgi:outer membrane protein TolC
MRFFKSIATAALGIFLPLSVFSQSVNSLEKVEVRLVDLIDRVIEFHPLIKSANLEINKGKSELLRSRGAFDPTLSFQQNQKNFDNISYYQVQSFSLESATRTGIKFQMGTEYRTVPEPHG